MFFSSRVSKSLEFRNFDAHYNYTYLGGIQIQWENARMLGRAVSLLKIRFMIVVGNGG